MLTLSQLKQMFPRSGANCARTGRIPIYFFRQHREEISQICRENKLRVIYRGPRPDLYQTMTRSADAVAAMLYLR